MTTSAILSILGERDARTVYGTGRLYQRLRLSSTHLSQRRARRPIYRKIVPVVRLGGLAPARPIILCMRDGSVAQLSVMQNIDRSGVQSCKHYIL